MRLLPLPVAPLAPFQISKFESACGRWWGGLPFVTLQFSLGKRPMYSSTWQSEANQRLLSCPACRAPSNLIFPLNLLRDLYPSQTSRGGKVLVWIGGRSDPSVLPPTARSSLSDGLGSVRAGSGGGPTPSALFSSVWSLKRDAATAGRRWMSVTWMGFGVWSWK
jgi:hypothetical protein